MKISMSIWLQVVLVMLMLVTHLGQILIVIGVSFRKCFPMESVCGLWLFGPCPVVLTLVHLREHFWAGFKVETAIC